MPDHLISYLLHLADNSLIMGHRLSEWTGHGPMLEQDIAISNIALDYIGQARNFYQYAAECKADGSSEDSLAYLREEHEFKNLLLVELPNGDWANTITKLFFFCGYQFLLYQQLIQSSDKRIAAIAEKSLKEVTYHRRWSSEWMIRMGDGTDESHQRVQSAVDDLFNYTGEMFTLSDYEKECLSEEIAVNLNTLKSNWQEYTNYVINEATLELPGNPLMHEGGKNGDHTEYLGSILTEMQLLQRTYPDCEW